MTRTRFREPTVEDHGAVRGARREMIGCPSGEFTGEKLGRERQAEIEKFVWRSMAFISRMTGQRIPPPKLEYISYGMIPLLCDFDQEQDRNSILIGKGFANLDGLTEEHTGIQRKRFEMHLGVEVVKYARAYLQDYQTSRRDPNVPFVYKSMEIAAAVFVTNARACLSGGHHDMEMTGRLAEMVLANPLGHRGANEYCASNPKILALESKLNLQDVKSSRVPYITAIAERYLSHKGIIQPERIGPEMALLLFIEGGFKIGNVARKFLAMSNDELLESLAGVLEHSRTESERSRIIQKIAIEEHGEITKGRMMEMIKSIREHRDVDRREEIRKKE